MRSRAGEDRHLEPPGIVGPLDVPVAGSLAILEQEGWFSTGFGHLDELTPAALLPRNGSAAMVYFSSSTMVPFWASSTFISSFYEAKAEHRGDLRRAGPPRRRLICSLGMDIGFCVLRQRSPFVFIGEFWKRRQR